MATIFPREIDEMLLNPGKGWMIFSSTNPGAYGTFPEASVAYLRLNWCDLEPEEGRYNWELWEPAMRYWVAHGKRLILAVMCANAHSTTKWCTPQWVADAGARGYDYTRQGDEYSGGAPIVRWEPDYGDPIFLTKLGQFLQAMARRYDGDPAIEIIDIRSYGIWGEWHTGNPTTIDVLKHHIDLHVENFRKTRLVVQWGVNFNIPAYEYAFDRGVGFRRDGIGGPPQGREVEMYPLVWDRAPVVFEFWGHYDYLKQKGWWDEYPVEAYMERQHASYISLYHERTAGPFVEREPAYIKRLGNRMGYWFILRQATLPDAAAPGTAVTVDLQWENRGVAVCLTNYPIALYLTDATGAVAHHDVSSHSDTRRWQPGTVTSESVTLRLPPGLSSGTYGVSLALVDSPITARPAIRLGIAGRDAAGRYPLGSLVV